VPHLGFPDSQAGVLWPLIFSPAQPAVQALLPFGDA
jgi:hypothetical protein